MKELDLSKPVQTRDGKPVRILASDLVGTQYPVVGVVTVAPGQEVSYTWHISGFLDLARADGTNPDDLVNTPEELVVYACVYRDSEGVLRFAGYFKSADDFNDDNTLGITKVVLREGQFDE